MNSRLISSVKYRLGPNVIHRGSHGWTGYQYDKDSGLKNKSGELTRPGYLGCSGFASIILQRMKYGKDTWLSNYDFKVQQIYGDEAAKLMGLTLEAKKAVADWKSSPPNK